MGEKKALSTNKGSGGDGIPVELFQILKDDAMKVLHLICQQIWKTQQWPQDWKRLVFIVIPKKVNAKECSNYHTIALISHASKVMLKILHSRAIPSFPSQLEWKIGLAWANTRGSLNSPSYLEKNHVAPPPSQDEALSRYSASGEVPP